MGQSCCGHSYCSECLMSLWESQHYQCLSCPTCSQPITLLFENYDEVGPTDVIQQQVRGYNYEFMNRPITCCERLRTTPYLLKRFVISFGTSRGVCNLSIALILIALLIYISLPADLIPESEYGAIGLVDDIVIGLILLYCLGRCFFGRYAALNSEAPAREAVIEQAPVEVPS
eukprot:TRINITY_DN27281_c0_g1_i1.p1 TRINITY_DN27281_c0_g1~~TRINITY_DN27281_c0_g1_i1.p1  ORF type:complete len:173 (+),score=10.33 TRINITY_DN27281_c0_g1_i1:124-642(+)